MHDEPQRLPRHRDRHFGLRAWPFHFDTLTPARSPWYEDEETVRCGLAWGRKKARLLGWVRSQMALRLTIVEQRCIELYYFRGLNYRDAAHLLDVNPSSVYRGVQRGLRKLRQAACERPDLKL